MSKKYNIGDLLSLKIEKIVPRGFGLAFAEDLTVFVPLAVSGDRVSVRITHLKKRTAFAEIAEILENGPDRIVPPCQYFGTCGGCDFQQIVYEKQIAAKLEIIRDCLQRIGKIDYKEDIPIIPSPKPFEYRSRARWHVDRNEQKIGYFKRDSHEVIDVAECPILTPDLQAALEDLRGRIDWGLLWQDFVEIEATAGEGGEVSIYSAEMIEPTMEVEAAVANERYMFSAETFFQGNQFLAGALVDVALRDAEGNTALDLYSGVGLFTIPLSRRFEKVVAVEGNGKAADFARKNAAKAEAGKITFARSGVGEFLSGYKSRAVDFVLLDPPRAGTEKNVIQNIIQLSPKHISYVSCEPSILARDLRMFLDSGYGIESVTALDLFPQTHHVETVVHLSRG